MYLGNNDNCLLSEANLKVLLKMLNIFDKITGITTNISINN